MKDECINCGAWKGLHHYETNQCPRNGQEAPVGKTQEWESTVYQEDNTADLRAEVARLKEGSEAMQEDAVQNTYAFGLMLKANKEQSEEIRTLKQELDQLKACKHMHVKIHSRLYRPSTREEPAEYEYKAECKDCGELFSADDVDEWAEVEE